MKSLYVLFAISIFTIGGAHLHPSFAVSPDQNANNSLITTRDLPTGTCNANTPCPIVACCGTNGLCGYSPSECGAGNCTSKCDSKAECGQYGVPGKQNCPLGVCCSQFGYLNSRWPRSDYVKVLITTVSVDPQMISAKRVAKPALEGAVLQNARLAVEVVVLEKGRLVIMNLGQIHANVKAWPQKI
jgi:hypothetical protein